MPSDASVYSHAKLRRLAAHFAQKPRRVGTNDVLWAVEYAPEEHGLIVGNEHNVEFLARRLRKWQQAEASHRAKSKYYDDDLVRLTSQTM